MCCLVLRPKPPVAMQLTQSGNRFDPQEINERTDFYIGRSHSPSKVSCFPLMKKRREKPETEKRLVMSFARKSNTILSLLRQIRKVEWQPEKKTIMHHV